MSTVSFSTIRSRFATAITSISGGGYTVSRNPFDPYNRNPQGVAHKRVSVGITSSEAREDSRQMSNGVFVESVCSIKWPFRLRPKDQVLDYDGALDSAEEVISTLSTRAAPLYTNLQIRFSRLSHQVVSSGEYMLLTLEFSCLHYISSS